MKTTIDRAGRVVIPSEIRKKARLLPGTELEVMLEDDAVRLKRKVERPRIEKRDGKAVIVFPKQAERLTPGEISRLIREERERQAGKQ